MEPSEPNSAQRRSIALFPLNVVLFPGMKLPLHIFEPRYREMLEQCLSGDLEFGVVLIRTGQEVGGPADPYDVGTLTALEDVTRLPDGRFTLIAEGTDRFRVVEITGREPFLVATVELLPEEPGPADALAPVVADVTRLFETYWRQLFEAAGRPVPDFQPATDPAALSYQVAVTLQIERREKQVLLELESVEERLREEIAILRNQVRRLERALEARRDQASQAADGFHFSNN